ncbi:MAG TPA: hypothetical protein PKL62_09500, partial [Accumulibacter sp.]|nr:hypothetical protein [Accumulibacter sp.]
MASVTQARRSALSRAPAGKPQENTRLRRAAAANATKGKAPAYLQAKLAMSTPGDASEQEAERVARQLARSPRAAAAPAAKANTPATAARSPAPAA